jgi:hypothetical protein
MHHRQMLQNGAWAAIIEGVVKAIFGNVQRLVAACTLIYALQDAIQTFGIDFAKVALQARIVVWSARPYKASAKERQRKRGIEAHHIARVVIDAMIVASALRVRNRCHQQIVGEGKAARFVGMERGPVKEHILRTGYGAIQRRERQSGIKEPIVQAVADLRLRLDAPDSIERINVGLREIA